MLVYASPRVLAEARAVAGDVIVEELVAVAIQGGLLRALERVDIELLPDERLARPLGARWVAVVARGCGRLVRRRRRSCWTIRPVVALSEDRP